MNDYNLLIDGKLVPGALTLPVINPATEEVVTHAPRASRGQLDEAVNAAAEAFPAWAQTSVDERRDALTAIAKVVTDNSDELAELITVEQGKPLREARREVGGTAAFFRYAATLEIPETTIADPDRDVVVEQLPLGPVAAIIPWNFPLFTIAFKLPWALLAGNTVVVKPAPTTPLTTLRFGELVAPLLPAGVLNFIVDDNDLGDALTSHPAIRKVSFTGSTQTGARVMAGASATVKRLTLELGGNDCALVLPDADPEPVADSIFRAAFTNNGQVCLAIKRVYVHRANYDAFVAALATRAEASVVGDGHQETTDLGPVQNAKQYQKLLGLLESAARDGRIVAGGTAIDGPGYFLRPTIVADIAEGTEIVDDEQFGPILPVVVYDDLDDAVKRVNNTTFGLGASVWSSDVTRAREVARRIDAGTVWVNKHADLAPHVPFGGAKLSGVGVEFGQQGLLEFTQRRVISS